ncbi:MAG: arginine--tRNA ligase [Candidatus Coatesbacteria bacterium]|nr:MAG: arginine--tRNA ligase [Candidatus Coatesbacteria bacterium]
MTDFTQNLRDRLAAALAAAGAEPGPEEADFSIPPEASHGDLTTRAALPLAKELGLPPRELAEQIASALREAPGVAAAEVAGPGFVNLRLEEGVLWGAVAEAVRTGDDYGRSDVGEGVRVQVEFVSANPTGPLNAVNARAAAYGDALARLLEFTGHATEREFYVCNVGTQMDLLAQSVRARLREISGEEAEIPEGGYRGEYVVDLARRLHAAGRLTPESDDAHLAAEAAEALVAEQESDLEDFGIIFDEWFPENSLYPDKVEAARERLTGGGATYEKDRALWLRTTAAGDDEDRVLVRADGRPTYFLADVAYHLDKHDRGFDKVLDVLGPDHHGHAKKLYAMVKLLGLRDDWLEIVISQQVNLLEGGEKVKMSKRAGALVTMREVIENIGVDAARFFFLLRTPTAHLDFDLELARKDTPENPVYYAQYCHARVESLKREAGEALASAPPAEADLGELDLPEERLLARTVWEFPSVVAGAAARREPHRLTAYAARLASLFHNYYHHHRILQASGEAKRRGRLLLARAVGQTMKNALGLLGVSAPTHM